MLQFINDMPEHVVGIHAIGEVTKEDYDKVLAPRLDELVNKQGEINYLLVLENTMGDFSAGAWYDELRLGLKHFTKWKKIAVVSDLKSVGMITNAIKFVIPGESKSFPLDQLDAAVAWVAEKEEQQEEAK